MILLTPLSMASFPWPARSERATGLARLQRWQHLNRSVGRREQWGTSRVIGAEGAPTRRRAALAPPGPHCWPPHSACAFA